MMDNSIERLLQLVVTTHSAEIASEVGRSGDLRAVDALMIALQTAAEFDIPYEPIFRYYAVRALGRLGDARAEPLLESIAEQEREPILKGRSISDMARKAIEHIHKSNLSSPTE
jgi:HEAT repeat protein